MVFLNQHGVFPKDVRDDRAQVFMTEEEKEEKKELRDISSEKFFWFPCFKTISNDDCVLEGEDVAFALTRFWEKISSGGL